MYSENEVHHEEAEIKLTGSRLEEEVNVAEWRCTDLAANIDGFFIPLVDY